MHSSSKRIPARRIPEPRSRKVEKNCSSARGSLRLCFSLLIGLLHAPVNQNRRNRSRSPAKIKWKALLNSSCLPTLTAEGILTLDGSQNSTHLGYRSTNDILKAHKGSRVTFNGCSRPKASEVRAAEDMRINYKNKGAGYHLEKS
jgi:hypothetical protein